MSRSAKASAQLHVLVTSLLGIGALAAGGGFAARLLYGGRYAPDTRTLLILGIASAIISLANLSLHDRIAQGKAAAARIWGVVAVASLCGFIVGDSGLALALVMGFSAIVMAGLLRVSSHGAPRPTPMNFPTTRLDFSLVVPMFNPGPRVVSKHLDLLTQELSALGMTFEIIVVDDGSTDGSFEEVKNSPHTSIELLHQRHAGKGHAVRTGMAHASGALIGFIDADGDIAASHVTDLLRALRSSSTLDGALASKNLDTASLLRRTASRLYRLVAVVSLDVAVPDTQTGLKLFRRDVVESTLPWCVERGFSFDAEFLAISTRLGHSRFATVPVDLKRFSTSTIRLRDAAGLLGDTFRVASRVGQLPIKPPRLSPHANDYARVSPWADAIQKSELHASPIRTVETRG